MFWNRKKKPAPAPFAGVTIPESVAGATSDDDLFAVARGAGVLREYGDDHPGWQRIIDALVADVEAEQRALIAESEARTTEALLAFQRDDDAEAAMRIFRGGES